MDYHTCPNLAAMFFDWAARRGERPFLWAKRDGAYLENLGTYNPTREPAEVKLDMERVRYWLARGAQPSNTVQQLIKGQTKAQAQPEA